MKREVPHDAAITFECATHQVQLVDMDGGPMLVAQYEGGANPLMEPDARMDGRYVIDLSFMDCPEAAIARGDAETEAGVACRDSWRAWVDA